jgi:hypothetical protein
MDFTDHDAEQLLEMLHKYVMAYTPDIPQTIPALAEDLAMGMDVTTDYVDRLRVEIESQF